MLKNKLEKILGFGVEETTNLDFGDFTANVAMVKAKEEGKNPREYATQLLKKIKSLKELNNYVDKIEVAGPGFINFWVKNDVLLSNLTQIDVQKEKYGRSDSNKNKLAIVEYSSANIAKPFTIGHLRSTIIGDAIANLLEATGWKIMRDNHLGDWGTQFGKQIYAIKTWGDIDEISKSENPVKDLVALYVKFHEEAEKDSELEDEARKWFKKLEDGDSEAREIWKKCIEWSFVEFDRIYKILGVTFDPEFENGRGLGESFFENRMQPVFQELEKAKLLKEGKEGAKLVFFEDDKYPPAMILKKDGATLYHTRDLATDWYRLKEYGPDLIINEVGMEQKLYFEQLFEIERLLGWFGPGQRIHVGHGLVRFKEGKMSTRKGNVIWMEDVLNTAYDKAFTLSTKGNFIPNADKMDIGEIFSQGMSDDAGVSDPHKKEDVLKVAVGALKYNDLKRDPKSDIVFDWNEILNMEGNSGPYLQYTVARCNSVIAKSTNKQIVHAGAITQSTNKFQIDSNPSGANFKFQIEEEQVLRTLVRFQDTISTAAKMYSPNLLCNYLYDLASKFNTFYNKHKILPTTSEVESENTSEVYAFRLALTAGTGQILKNGLKLLGIEAPEYM